MMRGTTLITLRRLVAARMSGRESERGVAMLTAILFMIIMAGVSSIILGVVTTQVTPSYTAQKGTKTIYAAQAGIQATLAVLRSAGTVQNVNGVPTTYGDNTKLPCSLSGTPNASTDGSTYTVTIGYYTVDPTPHATDSTWLNSPTNKIACTQFASASSYGTPGYGTASTPKFALITSAGTTTQYPIATSLANRSITAVYQFKLSNINIPGGLINNTGATACLQATTATPGSTIGWVAAASCGQTMPNATLQLWSYTSSWQLALASTQTGGVPGLCITGSVPTSPAGQTTVNATLMPCASDATRWNQLWSWTGSYTWEGETQAINGPNGSSWLTPGVPDGTSPINHFLQVSTSVTGTLAPTSLVGAGGAKYTTHQLVNYQEFGRCADITNEVILNPFQISYPCKQDPTGGTSYITWNQKWYYCEATDTSSTCSGVNPAAQQIYVYYQDNTSQKYCLTAPTAKTTPSPPAAATPVYYPYFTSCATSGANVALQSWNRIYNTGTFTTSYLLINNQDGLCLMANSGELFATSPAISELTLAQCNGQPYQQWNAVPTYTGGTVGGYREISGG